MRTILWIYSHPLIPEAGGTERITSLIQRGLGKIGYNCMDILVIDVKKEYAEYYEEEVTDIYLFLKENKVDVVINQLGQVPEFLRYFLDKGGKQWYDEGGKIISCLHFDPKPISYYHEIKAIYHKKAHDYYLLLKAWLFAYFYSKRDMRMQGENLCQVYNMSDAYILLSQGFIPYFKKATKLSDLSKLHCINNPLTFEGISDEAILEKKENTILVVSRMYERQKRITLVLKAWKILSQKASMKDWNLKIVGDGPDLERYEEYVTKKGLQRVSFEKQQSPEPYYEEAKIFLMTSIMEGWGLTLTESLQRGVVPVAFDTCSAFHDMIKDGENGFLVKEGSMGQFVKKVEQLANDDKLWRKMAKSALRSANRFYLDKIIQKWERII